jgi:trk system potassium uptake protein TrkH
MAVESLSYAVRLRVVGYYLGQLLFLVGCLATPTLVFAVVDKEWTHATGYLIAVAVLAGGGLVLQRGRVAGDIQWNEALVVVTAVYVLTPFVLALPMMMAGLGFLDALFEAISGITTTGLSTLASVEDKPHSLIFAAAWLQWLGGMGIMVLSFALLFGQSASAKRLTGVLTRQEGVLGGTRAYAIIIIRIYVGLTIIGVIALWLAHAGLFSAVTLTLAAVSTGGFSPFNSSLAGASGAIQTLVILLCGAGAIALPLYYEALHGKWKTLLRDPELHALLIFGGLVSALLIVRHWSEAATADGRTTDFILTAFSAQTTAGFSSIPVSQLDAFSKAVLIVSMAIGGGVGSSAGGIKLLRLIVLIRLTQLLILKTRLTPHAAVATSIADRDWLDSELVRVLVIVGLFAGVIAVSWLVFLWYGYDPLDALFEVVSATGTVGLSSGITGPALEPALKGVLCLDMLLGRLEILPLLVFLAPRSWIGQRQDVSSETQKGAKP